MAEALRSLWAHVGVFAALCAVASLAIVEMLARSGA